MPGGGEDLQPQGPEKKFDLADTGEFVPLKEDPVEILKRGRKKREGYWSEEGRRKVEDDTKKEIIDNAGKKSPEEKT